MKFEEFKENVQQWAESRGIYAHSTPEAQLLKTLSELGELADAVIKGDYDGLRDAIGDVAVCVVNWAKMVGLLIEKPVCEDGVIEVAEQGVGEICFTIGNILSGNANIFSFDAQFILNMLVGICQSSDTEEKPVIFTECCELAWNEIKGRKGRMVAGGAFVKEGEDA
jgi:NTP pyrophosphatase (non-canonical NTP hydrolase)